MFIDMMKAASMSRRSTLLGGLGLGAAALGAGMGIGGTAAAADAKRPNSKALDFTDPKDNVYAFTKLWFGIGEPVFGAYHGVQYALIGTNRLVPVFGYAGGGHMQGKILENGNARIRAKEVGVFTDLVTGEVLEEWKNPWTGEVVKPFNFFNDRVRGEIGTEMPKFQFGTEEDEATVMNEADTIKSEDGSIPFILPWQSFGDQYTLAWDYAHEYTNPVTPEKWPKASTGARINPSEHFVFYTPKDIMDDRSEPSAPFHSGFFRQGPWWPWMMMGGSGVDGALIGRMHSYKITGTTADYPTKLLNYIEKHYPDYFVPADDWDDGFPIGTWEAYARDVPPEV
jgi:hypothetical protein